MYAIRSYYDEMERLDPLNLKDDKSSYSPYTSNNREKNCCHLWVLEKSEDEKLFIKIIPFRDNLFKRIVITSYSIHYTKLYD